MARRDGDSIPGDVKPLRVLHVVKALGRGGLERVVFDIARGGRELGHVHEVGLVMVAPNDMVPEFLDAGIPLHTLSVNHVTGLIRVPSWVRRLGRERSFDVVHGHFPLTSSFERLARPGATWRYVFSHHMNPTDYSLLTRLMHRATWRLVDQGVSVSSAVQRDVQGLLHGRVASTVVNNGIDTVRFTRERSAEEAKRLLRFDPSKPVVGLVAALRPEKRINRWLEVAAAVRQKICDAHFIIVGSGSELGPAQAKAEALGLRDAVTFVGRVSDPRPWLEAMDLFLLTSDYEGFGLVVVEAMSMGVVPVVTAVGPLADIVQSPWGVAAPTEVAALSSAVSELLLDSDRRIAMAREAVRVARERYGVDRMVREYHDVYASLVRIG